MKFTKEDICKELLNVTKEVIIKEWNVIKNLSLKDLNNLNGRSKLGCKILDYYFFINRLETKGNKGINFFDFVENIDKYLEKKYIQNLLSYCEKNNRYKESIIKKYFYCYGLCFGRINAFKITNALEIYHKYKPSKVLDPFCGFGGRLLAAMMLDIDYIGVDLNESLKVGYDKLIEDFSHISNSKIDLCFEDSLTLDYSKIEYDMIFSSPPYFNIEIYENSKKKSMSEWKDFYDKIFRELYKNLKSGGTFIININSVIYERILVPLFNDAHEIMELKKSSKNQYKEFIYIWKK
jgi:DNA modification methylase